MLNRVANLGSNSQIPRGNTLTNERNSEKKKRSIFRTSRSASKSRQNISSSAVWNNHSSSNIRYDNSNNKDNEIFSYPKDLSWEQIITNDGFKKHFLKIFCEKVREGDHFKTIRINGSTTAGSVVKELVDTYYLKYGTRDDFCLYEIIGHIQPVPSPHLSATPIWSFTERNTRQIDLNENIISLLQNTIPGYGLCRRLELRPVNSDYSTSGSMFMKGSRSINGSQASLRGSVSTSQTTLNSSRSCTPVNGITNFKDSRRGRAFRGLQIPHGPYFLLLRGNQPDRDVLLHDVTKLIIDNAMQSYMTIGYGKHVDIRLYPTPSEMNSSEGDCIIAKVVGYNVLNTSNNSSKESLVFLEPWDQGMDPTVSSSGSMTPNSSHRIQDNIEIYVNDNLVKPSCSLKFQRQQLLPGDLVFFGSRKRGYVYLFKDPRCIPDHKLELSFTKNDTGSINNMEVNRNVKNIKTNVSNDNDITPRSSEHDSLSVYSSSVLEDMKQYKAIPALNELEWIIEPLLVPLKISDSTLSTSVSTSSLSSSISQKLISLDALGLWDIETDSILEPWRSACLLSLLIRAIGLTKLRNDNTTVTTSVNTHKNINNIVKNGINTKNPGFNTLRNNSIEHLFKQITSILSNYQKRVELTESGRIVFQFWLSLFFYDLAVYLTPNWLTHDIKCPSVGTVDVKDNTSSLLSQSTTPSSENRHQNTFKSDLSLNHLFGELLAPETLAEIEEIRKLSYTLADQIIDQLIKTTCHSISPYISALYQSSPHDPPLRSQPDRIYLTSPTEWTCSRSELCKWLDRLASCFDAAFYPSGGTSMSVLNDNENLSTNSDSAHSFVSNKSHNGILFNNRVNNQQQHRRTYQQSNQLIPNLQKYSETSDLSMSGGDSDMDNEYYSGYNKPVQMKNLNVPDDEVFSTDYSKNNSIQSIDHSFSHHSINSTMNRIEAIFWRRLLANISYEILNTILFTGTVKIDQETGTHLLNGINWLDSWLRIHRLDKHKRPLNILIQVANLLATPRKQLLKMTWNEMREAYSYIPPALLRFLLEEYEEGFGAQNANSWSIDEKDAAVVDEDPTDLIEISLKGWRSKERLLPGKTYANQSPIYKPVDPYGLCNQSAMQTCINQLDGKLSAIQSPVIHFRWQELMRGFPPPRVVPQIHINHNHPFNRSTIRNKLAIANRKRLPIRSTNGRMSISPSVMNQNTTLIENSEFSPLPNKTQTSQFDNSMKSIDKTSKFSNDMKPKPSSGEPVWGGSHSSGMNNPQDTSMDSKQKALYYLKGLAASIGGIDLIANANGDQDFLSSESKYSNNLQMGSKVNDYPQENVYHSQVFNRKVTSPHWQNQMLETNRTEIPVSSWYHDPRLQVPNGLSQSLGDFNNGFRPPSNAPSLSRLNIDQLNETANDWKQYRMSLLGQGLDKIRTSKAGSRSVTPRLISNRNVSSSMSNLPINQFKIPDMIIHEAADNISEVVSELDRGRDTDSDAMSSVNLLDINPERELSDVLTRSGLGNSVSNVTLYKEPNSGFGLVLVDGERTSLDQPGIFVKSVAPNSVAEMNGTFRLGDRILAINGRDLTSMTYKDALALLRQCVSQTTFTVLRCNLPDPEALLKRKEI
ncbi:unnamed protein product [Schistosoma margrebowiei]|uniref:PDZ domain-containing protein n=1 Tax=Schistosoma margrebowiei TaxID=48269 RepID=A0AA84Z775_9TREM|nr:unnamed protein product [Schistosoma margrebowiei]